MNLIILMVGALALLMCFLGTLTIARSSIEEKRRVTNVRSIRQNRQRDEERGSGISHTGGDSDTPDGDWIDLADGLGDTESWAALRIEE